MISYNDLYEILRKEKYGEVLQALPKEFLEDFNEYLNEKKMSSNSEDNLFQEEAIKSKKQFENSISLFKELFRVRKKKLLNLVFVATETGIMKRDYENMLGFERDLFDSLVKDFEKFDKSITEGLVGKKKADTKSKMRMVMFNQEVQEFVDMSGRILGPYASGELANLDFEVAEIFVSGGRAGYVDE